ncbi:hypothetical protein SS1G_12199 [Sclerotinia sclerotiorum 1980 UF-70]|uniref:3-hydroxyisobutyrate dehydrogenase n=2 Tax=Sclerotinia sclerotiorum (strain ATCC 18683 / 1980 / Ss-1) TaxID=665079 RepID=A7F2Q1_SCLS1|nr:hypothetical protein SS1G_12199 [Sclerotinia sclerotiorum 1980 UF-70]APA09401.1 hypothetical protein sscle_05g041710 [Sclerotinia sclerotiorum 1980 UF-70]EDN95993.1 hypothetical protein SS1G_12199 [Sclerotinia sclerotiorum 1980 UF-70]
MSSPNTPNVAFIGLGAMGMGMATNLLKTFSVAGFDVYGPTLEKFRSAGGHTATTPRSAVSNAKYIVIMVATAAQTLSVLFDDVTGAIHELQPNATIILSSTAFPEHVPEVRQLLDNKYNRKDVDLVDAPVSGGTGRAALGTLVVLASGPEKSIEAAKPVLNAMADPLYIIPGGLGAGTKVKMVHQALAGIHMIMASEAMGYAAFLGLNTKQAFDYLTKSPGGSWMLENRAPHMLENNLHPHSALNIMVKDMGIVTADGRRVKCPLFLCSAAEQVLVSGVRSGFGLEDDSGLVRAYIPTQPSLVFEHTTAAAITPDDPRLKLVEDILAGVHLVAATEAMAFAQAIGLDSKMLYDIVKGAAGASAMFVDRVPALLSGKCASNSSIDDIIARLEIAIEEASRVKFPLHLAATALQILQLASARGFGDEPDVAVAKIWDSKVKFPSPVFV